MSRDLFAFSKASGLALGPSGGSLLEGKAAGESSWPLLCSAKVKNEWSHNSIPTYNFMDCTGTTLHLHILLILDFNLLSEISSVWICFLRFRLKEDLHYIYINRGTVLNGIWAENKPVFFEKILRSWRSRVPTTQTSSTFMNLKLLITEKRWVSFISVIGSFQVKNDTAGSVAGPERLCLEFDYIWCRRVFYTEINLQKFVGEI